MDTSKVTRVEVIDHTKLTKEDIELGDTERGRVYVKWEEDVRVELSFQDRDRTLKIFISDKA